MLAIKVARDRAFECHSPKQSRLGMYLHVVTLTSALSRLSRSNIDDVERGAFKPVARFSSHSRENLLFLRLNFRQVLRPLL